MCRDVRSQTGVGVAVLQREVQFLVVFHCFVVELLRVLPHAHAVEPVSQLLAIEIEILVHREARSRQLFPAPFAEFGATPAPALRAGGFPPRFRRHD